MFKQAEVVTDALVFVVRNLLNKAAQMAAMAAMAAVFIWKATVILIR